MLLMAEHIERDTDLLTSEQVAQIVKRTKYTVERWFRQKTLPSAFQIAGGSWLIKRGDLYSDLEAIKRKQQGQ